MHKEDLWFASRCGWGCLESEKQMPSPGPAAFSRSQLAHPRREPQLGRRKEEVRDPPSSSSSSIPGYKPPLSRGPGSSLPSRQGAGPDHRAGAGAETHARSAVNWGTVGAASGPCLGHQTLQRSPSVGQARVLGFRRRRRLLGGIRLRQDSRRRPPTQCSPGRRHQPEQRRTGARNAPPIGQA